MGLGTGVSLFTIGAILYWAVDVNLPFVDDNALGAILMLVGVVAVTSAVLVSAGRRQTGTTTGVGSGVAMLAIGAILYWAVNVNIPFVSDGALGVILMIGGAVSVLAALLMHHQSSRAGQAVGRRW